MNLTANINGITIDTKYFDEFGGSYETVYFDKDGTMLGIENNKRTYELADAIKTHNRMVAQLVKRIS